MEEAAAIRRAALDAVGDVEPAGLRERIGSYLDDGSVVPGVLTLLTVGSVTESPVPSLGSVDSDLAEDSHKGDELATPVAERAAGVQLIYEGLRLTRELAHANPWEGGNSDEADLDVLVADVLVARGFFLLARTEASEAAVETVRAFGRDQTVRRETDNPALDRNLEADVLELAVVAGTAAGGQTAPPQLREFAATAARETTDERGFAPSDSFFSEALLRRLWTVVPDPTSGEGVTPSVDD